MSYQVLARKYRPQTFDEVIGQEPVVRALTNALQSDRTAHAYLFSGIRGVGKTTTARLLAKALNCDQGPTAEPCGQCASCREVPEGSALDVIEIDAATYTKVDNMREVLEKTRYSPARDAYKVYIVDEVHMLSTSAFNALLKTLEEPPAHVVFILATTELRKVPATIVSRCQHYEFRPVAHGVVVDRLEELCRREEAGVSTDALSLIARRAGGSVRDALSLLDLVLCYGGGEAGEGESDGVLEAGEAAKILGIADSRALSALVEAMGEGAPATALERLDEILSWGADPVQVHAGLVEHLRNLVLARVVERPGGLLAAGEEEIEEWKELAAGFKEAELLRLLQMAARSESDVRHAAQPRYLLEALVVRCCLLDRLRDIEEVLEELGPGPGPGESAAPPSAAGSPKAGGKGPSRARRATTGEPGDTPSERASEPAQAGARGGSAEAGTQKPAPADPPQGVSQEATRDAPRDAPRPAQQATGETTEKEAEIPADPAEAARMLSQHLTRASLRRWVGRSRIRAEGGRLHLELPAGRNGAKRTLQGDAARKAILEAARRAFRAPLHDLDIETAEGRPASPSPEPAADAPPEDWVEAGGPESGSEPPADASGDENEDAAAESLRRSPQVQTLLEVFQGEIRKGKKKKGRGAKKKETDPGANPASGASPAAHEEEATR